MGLFDKTLPRFGVKTESLGEHLAIPLTLCAYSVFKNYNLRFDDSGEIENEEDYISDSIFKELAGIHASIKGKPWLYDKKPLKDFYYGLSEVSREEYFNEVYPSILKEILPAISGTDKKYYTPPADVESIVEILKTLNVKSVYDGNWALPLIACSMEDDIEYGIGIGDEICRAISRVLLDYYGKKNVKIVPESLIDIRVEHYTAPGDEYVDSSDEWETAVAKTFGQDKKFDAVVVYGFNHGSLDLYSILHAEERPYVRDEKNLANKYILFVIDTLYGSLPEVLEGGKLIRVTKGFRYILTFDLAGGHDNVLFQKSYKDIVNSVNSIPYKEIRRFDNYIYPSIYFEPHCEEGMVLVRLEDVASPAEQAVKESDKKLYPTYSLSSAFDKVASKMFRPRMEALPRMPEKYLWRGTNLHIKYDRWNKKMTGCIGRSKDVYYCESPISITAKEDRIKVEYLALVLLNDPTFSEFTQLDLPIDLIIHRKIAIVPDLDQQAEIVAHEFEKLRDVVNSDGVYSILPVSPIGLFDEKAKGELEGWNLLVMDYVSSMYGDNGLKSLLSDSSSRPRPDAIIVDPSVDASGARFKGLQKALTLSREHKIPLFVYSSIPSEALRVDLEEDDLHYCEDGHLFYSGDDSSLKRLATAIRDELDKNGTLSAQLRSRYRREFKAADWIKNNWGINVPQTLLEALMTPNKHLNDVRQSAESLLKRIATIIAPGTLLDQTKGGWLAKFFMKRAWADNEKTHKFYVLEGTLMEKTLATSVDYMYLLLNGASHGGSTNEESGELNVLSYLNSSGTSNIAMAALNIYMDFIVWLAGTEGVFNASCTMKDSQNELTLNIRGIVHRVNSQEYYIETDNDEYQRIHFWPGRDTQVSNGSSILIKTVTDETRDRQKYKWFAKDWEIIS